MFGLGYSKPVDSAADDDDENNMLGGGRDDFPNVKDDFRGRQKAQSMGGGSGFGSSSGFGGGSSGFGNDNYGSSDKDPFKVDKDAWLKGNDSNDPFGSKDKSKSSLFADPFKSSSSSNSSGNNLMGSGGFGSGSGSSSSSNYNDPFAAPSSPPKMPDFYTSEAAMGGEPVYACVSCYNKMSKKLATQCLKLKPNDASANYGSHSSTLCDVCQRGVKEVRDSLKNGSPMNTSGIGSDSRSAFPRPNDGGRNSSHSGDGRTSFGGGDGRNSFGYDGRGSMDSRGSEDLTSGMIRMQPASGKSNSVFGNMFGGGGGKKY